MSLKARVAVAVLLAMVLVAGIYVYRHGIPARWQRGWQTPGRATGREVAALRAADRAAFDRWLAAEPHRAREFAAFEAFVTREGFADMLAPWTLLRANASNNVRCPVAPFVLPPRAQWPHILPALRLIRQQVIPTIGAVRVASAYRDAGANACSKGAGASRHMQFAALDVVPVAQPPAADHFAKLCAAWRRAGPRSDWGLGAYFDPAKPEQNPIGRFHVDGTGWRTWGFTYKRASSRCVTL